MVYRRIFRWCLVFLWLAVSIYISRQPSVESGQLSNMVAGKVFEIINAFDIEVSYKKFHLLVRECAHFGVHFILAMLVFRALFISLRSFRATVVLGLFFCVLVALFNEAIQYSASGRAVEILDFLLNLCGTSFGEIFGIISVNVSQKAIR